MKSELLAVYCFTFERFLHDPEDLIEESSSLILETSSAFSTEPLPEDRDEIFWKSFDKMRIIAEDDIVALSYAGTCSWRNGVATKPCSVPTFFQCSPDSMCSGAASLS